MAIDVSEYSLLTDVPGYRTSSARSGHNKRYANRSRLVDYYDTKYTDNSVTPFPLIAPEAAQAITLNEA
eukprot:scaffold64379_cov43-Attheya_sp.AAC.2